MSRKAFSTARVVGALNNVSAARYRVHFKDRTHAGLTRCSPEAPLDVCLRVASNYNLRAKAELAFVKLSKG